MNKVSNQGEEEEEAEWKEKLVEICRPGAKLLEGLLRYVKCLKFCQAFSSYWDFNKDSI